MSDAANLAPLGRTLELFGKKRTLIGGVVVLAFWLLAIFAGKVPQTLDRLSVDLATRWIGELRAPHPSLLVVGIDDQTLESVPERWPWSRGTLARLLEKIVQGNPRLVVMDILLRHPEAADEGKGDRALAEVIRASGRVGLVTAVQSSRSELGTEMTIFRNAEVFSREAAFEGFAQVRVDEDGLVRRFTPADPRMPEESCALQAARKIASTVGDLPAPGSASDEYLLAFARRGGGIPFIRASDLLSGDVSPELLRYRVVVLGATAKTLQDQWATPCGIFSGPMLLATAVDSLVSGRALIFPRGSLRCLLALLSGMAFGLWFGGAQGVGALCRSAMAAGLTLVFGTMLMTAGLGFLVPLGWLATGWWAVSLTTFLLSSFVTFLDIRIAKAEAAAAGVVQQRLFPEQAWTDPLGFHCRGKCLPCEESGGDYFDFFPLPDGALLFLIADVAGHGIPAAMVTVMAKTTVHLMIQAGETSPNQILERLNLVIYQLAAGEKLITAVVGRLSPKSGEILLAPAGHVAPVLVKQDGTLKELALPSLPIGLRKTRKPREMQLELAPGDRLLLYSDGIPEALDWANIPMGYDLWYSHLSRVLPGFGTQTPLESLLEPVRNHARGKPFSDDVTLLLLQREMVSSG